MASNCKPFNCKRQDFVFKHRDASSIQKCAPQLGLDSLKPGARSSMSICHVDGSGRFTDHQRKKILGQLLKGGLNWREEKSFLGLFSAQVRGRANAGSCGTEMRAKKRAGGLYTPPDVEAGAGAAPVHFRNEVLVGVRHWSTIALLPW